MITHLTEQSPDVQVVAIPREAQMEIVSTFATSSLTPLPSVAFPRTTGELEKGEITWETLDRVSNALPNPLMMLFTIGD